MKQSTATEGESPSRLIDAKIKSLDDWRGKTLAHVRALIKQATPKGGRRVEVEHSGLVPGRHPLHRRDLQGQGEADFCQRRCAG